MKRNFIKKLKCLNILDFLRKKENFGKNETCFIEKDNYKVSAAAGERKSEKS